MSVLSFPIYPGSASLIFGFLMLLKAGAENRMQISHFPPGFFRDPRLVQEKLFTFQKGCQQWSSGTRKGDTCTLPSLENPTWEKALMLPQQRGLWNSLRAVLVPSQSHIPAVEAQELPQGLAWTAALAGEIICECLRALPWAARGGFGDLGLSPVMDIRGYPQGRDGSPGVGAALGRCCSRSWEWI